MLAGGCCDSTLLHVTQRVSTLVRTIDHASSQIEEMASTASNVIFQRIEAIEQDDTRVVILRDWKASYYLLYLLCISGSLGANGMRQVMGMAGGGRDQSKLG